jgi:hypothetical protein
MSQKKYTNEFKDMIIELHQSIITPIINVTIYSKL